MLRLLFCLFLHRVFVVVCSVAFCWIAFRVFVLFCCVVLFCIALLVFVFACSPLRFSLRRSLETSISSRTKAFVCAKLSFVVVVVVACGVVV